MRSFEELFTHCLWKPIRGCPGRFALAGGPSIATPRELAGEGAIAREAQVQGAPDPLVAIEIEGGGLISFRKGDGRFIHTLNTAEGFRRKLRTLGLEAAASAELPSLGLSPALHLHPPLIAAPEAAVGKTISELAAKLPRFDLGIQPTPIEELPRLSAALGGPRLFVKRDDQTGLAGGGNKARKLEFSVGEALSRGADTLITLGGPQSNHCRQTAAAAIRAGLRCILVLRGPRPAEMNGNLLLDSLLGAELRFSDDRPREEVAAEVFQAEEAAGRRPFLIPLGASDVYGSPGYALAAEEIATQLDRLGVKPDLIVLASSSFGTQAGLCVGMKALGLKLPIAAVAIDSPKRKVQEGVAALADATARRLGLDLDFSPDEILAYDGYLGGGYAVLGEPEIEAIRLAARCEGLLLDPVYTGRAMAGLIDLIRRGEFRRDETILFLHTGGSAALFAYAGLLA